MAIHVSLSQERIDCQCFLCDPLGHAEICRIFGARKKDHPACDPNFSTGKVLDINASGPARLFLQPGTDTLLAESGGVSFFYIQNPPAGIPSYALTTGRVVSELDLTTFSVVNLITHHGTVQDICQLL